MVVEQVLLGDHEELDLALLARYPLLLGGSEFVEGRNHSSKIDYYTSIISGQCGCVGVVWMGVMWLGLGVCLSGYNIIVLG